MKFAIRILILASLASMGMGSCSTGIEETCREQLPAFNQELHQIHQELAQYAPEGRTDRAVASVSQRSTKGDNQRSSLVVDFPEDAKMLWQDWSEKRLVDVERYTDFVRTRSQYRPALEPLQEVANELVKFDGYIAQGKVVQAMESLHQAQLNADAVARITCTSAPEPSAK